MKIPYIQHIGIGIHITDSSIRWVELSRINQRIQVVNNLTEDISDCDLSEGLKNLVSIAKPKFPFVTVNLDSAVLSQDVIDVPFFEDSEELDEWINETYLQLIEMVGNSSEVVVSHQLLGTSEEMRKCLFVTAEKKVVQERIGLIKSAGLQPVAITTGDIETGYTLLFNEEYAEGNTWLLRAYEDHSTLMSFSDGMPSQYHRLADGLIRHEDLSSEAETIILSQEQSKFRNNIEICVLANDKIMKQLRSNEENYSIKFSKAAPLSGLNLKNEALKADYAVAAGMALSQLYPASLEINLLTEEAVWTTRDSYEKKEAINTVICAGIFLGVLLMLLGLFQFILNSKSEQVDTEVLMLEDKITAVTDARGNIEDLRKSVNQARKQFSSRTNTALVLEKMGHMLPSGLWLTGLQAELLSDEGGDMNLRLIGLARNEAAIANLLDRAEQTAGFENVKLVLSEQVKSSDYYNMVNLQPQHLVLFQVVIDVKPQK